ncbi:DedA family protein [Flexivirga sp. B27]
MSLVVLFLLVVADGIVPPVPSEAVLLAHAPGAMAHGWAAVVGLWALAAAGAFLGDVITYFLGRGIGTRRFAWQRRAWVARVLERTGVELNRRGAPLILSARLLPGWRVAITFLAGATRMAPARFFAASACGASMWAAYMIGIGATVGALTGAGPIVVAAVSLTVLTALAKLVRWLRRRWIPGASRRPSPYRRGHAPTSLSPITDDPSGRLPGEPRVHRVLRGEPALLRRARGGRNGTGDALRPLVDHVVRL